MSYSTDYMVDSLIAELEMKAREIDDLEEKLRKRESVIRAQDALLKSVIDTLRQYQPAK